MRISDWSSDVCSSDLKCHTERAAFEPRFQAASKRVHPGVQFAIGECACAGIPDLDEREIVLPAAEQHISEVLGHPGFSTNSTMVLRSEERRVGKECVSTCRSRWSPYT